MKLRKDAKEEMYIKLTWLKIKVHFLPIRDKGMYLL